MKDWFMDDEATIMKWARAFGYMLFMVAFCAVLVIASGIF